jgi:RNA polymerase sigma factor (sigma-70 family)
MMTASMISAAANNDAELVNETLFGDRDAFGKIVSRYQSLVCSLAYSATGSLGQSEDLAQEIFIIAWKHLGHLRERHKLRSWLCGIARNRINNFLRREGREPVRAAAPLEEISESHSPEPLPRDHTISNEEQAILWRSLERIPEIYREPLVLFYREHQSIEAVAQNLELTEDTVKQRLSRGRKMLHEEVLAFVEGALERTNPSKAFTLAVVAALPLLATTAKAATAGATAAKGSAAAKATGLGSLLQAILPIGAFVSLGGWLGYKMGSDAGQSQQQRESVGRFWGVLAASLVLFVLLPLLLGAPLMLLFGSRENVLAGIRIWLDVMFAVVVVAFGLWLWQRRKSRQSEAAGTCGSGKVFIIWSVTLAVILAGAFLALGLSDSNFKVERISGTEAQKIISAKGSTAQFFVMRCYYHSAFKQSDKFYDELWIKFQANGRVVTLITPADPSALALLAQQGIQYPTYVEGRDFGIFGWQGHLLMVLCLFVLATGATVLLTISLKNKSKTPIMTKGTKIGIVAAIVLAVLIVTPLVWLKHRMVNSVQPNQIAPQTLTPERAAQAKQTARDFFVALEKSDWNKIDQLCPQGFPLSAQLDDQAKTMLNGLEIISLGEPFTKPPYPGVFVPYEIRFKNGGSKKYNLAVRQDNPERKWYWDGGL